jgi:hypothetical protein
MLDATIATPLPPGLEPAEPGWVWIENGGTWRLIPHGDPQRALMERQQAEAQREATRAFFAEQEASRQAQAERDAAIKALVSPILAASDGQTDKQLGVDTVGVPPARVALLRCLSQIEQAHDRRDAALLRRAEYLALATRRDSAVDALSRFESEVREAFEAHHSYGATGEAPSPRTEERQRLMATVEAAQWELVLASAAADGLAADAAGAVVEELEARLPALRADVLIENSLPVCVEIQRLAEEIRDRFAVMAALGAITGALPSKATVKMPSLPFGSADFVVDATDFPALTAAISGCLEALVQDPHADLTLPGTAPREPTGASLGCFSRIRNAVRAARN